MVLKDESRKIALLRHFGLGGGGFRARVAIPSYLKHQDHEKHDYDHHYQHEVPASRGAR